MFVLEVEKLNLGYGARELIKNLSFRLAEPSFVAVLGHNGCGKSTFFKSLIKAHPYEGKILMLGQDLQSISPKFLSSHITMLEQKNSVNFNIPVEELVVMGKFSKKTLFENYTEEDYNEVQGNLERLNIGTYSKKNFIELSGGEQQLVWLAQAMLQDVEIYLFDEPTQQLDVYNRKKIFDLLLNIVEEKNKTVFCVTHDVNNLFGMRGYVLNLSTESPALEPITEESVKRNIAMLERQKVSGAA